MRQRRITSILIASVVRFFSACAIADRASKALCERKAPWCTPPAQVTRQFKNGCRCMAPDHARRRTLKGRFQYNTISRGPIPTRTASLQPFNGAS